MDARIKSGHDEWVFIVHPTSRKTEGLETVIASDEAPAE
jgi:hypothetical protein